MPDLEPRQPAPARSRMHPVLKGCLIALAILGGLILLAIGTCFALMSSF